MTLYIDKENIINWVKSRESDSFMQSIQLIKKNIDVHYNFPKEEMLKNPSLGIWFRSVKGQGVNNQSVFAPEVPEFPPYPRKTNFYTQNSSLDVLTSVYLLEDANVCDSISEKGSILIGKVGQEQEIFDSLLALEDKEIQSVTIGSWNNYCPVFPLTDIIVCDNHYFKNKAVYEKNDNELISVLARGKKESPIHLVIITKEDEIDSSLDLNVECQKILDLLKKSTSSKKCSVIILTTRKTHDRSLITNYYRMTHGSSFHLKDLGLKNNVVTDIKPHSRQNAWNVTQNLIDEYQTIASAPVRSFGKSDSNFLKFH